MRRVRTARLTPLGLGLVSSEERLGATATAAAVLTWREILRHDPDVAYVVAEFRPRLL
jgi:hypothetical protein